jgi:hypothetical protein
MRHFLENLRILLLPPGKASLRCLHFPATPDEHRTLIPAIANIKEGRISQRELVFAIRSISSAFPGRCGFDLVRMLEEAVAADCNYSEDPFGLFAVLGRSEVLHRGRMTRVAIPMRSQAKFALWDGFLAIATARAFKICDMEGGRATCADLAGVTVLRRRDDGHFVVGDRSGAVYDIDCEGVVRTAAEVGFAVGSVCLSAGAARMAVCDEEQKRIAWHDEIIELEEAFVDIAVNGDDLYIAYGGRIEYRTYEYFVQNGDPLIVWETDEAIHSIAVDSANQILGVCASEHVFLLDSRAPRVIAALNLPESKRFMPSPFMDIAVIFTSTGFATIDMKRMDEVVARCTFSRTATTLVGEWILRSRLLAVAFPGKFIICSPYLRRPVLECYPIEQESVMSVHANLTACVVAQDSTLIVFGGFGHPIRVGIDCASDLGSENPC